MLWCCRTPTRMLQLRRLQELPLGQPVSGEASRKYAKRSHPLISLDAKCHTRCRAYHCSKVQSSISVLASVEL